MKSFMKRTVRVISACIVVTALAIPAHSFSPIVDASQSLIYAIARTRDKATPAMSRAKYAVSKFDNRIVKAFEKAWQRSSNGTSSYEGVVLILRMADGSFSGKDMGATHEYKRFTFPWHPAAIAIVHTHPNTSDPWPCGEDLIAAEKYSVPIFTITRRGMFVYDPGTKKISKVMDDLDWLDQARWNKLLLGQR